MGGTPPPPIADGKTSGNKLAEIGGTPQLPITDDFRDSVSEPFPYRWYNY